MASKRTAAQRAADKRRTGRPAKQTSERRSKVVTVYLTEDEHARLEALATEQDASLASTIMRPWREGS
jgi:hypothetical protein